MTTAELIQGGQMVDIAYKVRENRARRAALRQGLRLEKAKVRDPRATDFGTYRLVDDATNAVRVHGGSPGNRFGLTLDDVEQALDANAR